MTIFPIIQPTIDATLEQLPLCRETKWDFEADCPVWENGEPVMVQGADAVAVWAWNALKTARYRYEIFTWNYGCEIDTLIGQNITSDLKQAEALRFLRECLAQNPYITGVSNASVTFEEERMTVSATIETVYGDITLEG